jgi:prepilin-type N-terminal cleavage/methylation domain-containing protein
MTFTPTDRINRNRRTILVIGDLQPRSAAAVGGFSMVEILLVIALIGILASIFVINFDTLLRQNETDSLEQAFWTASSEARNRAMFERRAQDLRYDPESQAYLIGAGENVKRYAVETSSWSDETQVEVLFKQRLSDDSYRLIGGKLITLREAPIIRFFPDGTCMPFILEIRVDENLRSIEVDPWSGAELLASEDER